MSILSTYPREIAMYGFPHKKYPGVISIGRFCADELQTNCPSVMLYTFRTDALPTREAGYPQTEAATFKPGRTHKPGTISRPILNVLFAKKM